MSIRAIINDHLGQRLWLLKPTIDSDPVVRTMFISQELRDVLKGPWPNAAAERRCSELKADLDTFVRGDRISVCLHAFEAGDAYLGRLEKPTDEVWDIRSRKPKPGLRVIGRFAEPDTFVALTCWPRSKPVDFLSRPPLSDRHSVEWDLATNECKSEWRKLFYTYPAHGTGGDDVHVYVTNNVIPV